MCYVSNLTFVSVGHFVILIIAKRVIINLKITKSVTFYSSNSIYMHPPYSVTAN